MQTNQIPSAVLALIAAASASCALPSRRVVPEHIFRYAAKSNRDIATELPASEAYEVLKGLGRIEGDSLAPTAGQRIVSSLESPRIVALSTDNAFDDADTPYRTVPREAVLKSGHYFSTMTAIAVESGLDPTPIPALVVGYRPEFSWDGLDFISTAGVGFDLVLGGALNSLGSGAGSSDLELAVGLGITIPWSDSGALSIGAITWREEGTDAMGGMTENTEIAAYIGISLGSFNVQPQQQ